MLGEICQNSLIEREFDLKPSCTTHRSFWLEDAQRSVRNFWRGERKIAFLSLNLNPLWQLEDPTHDL